MSKGDNYTSASLFALAAEFSGIRSICCTRLHDISLCLFMFRSVIVRKSLAKKQETCHINSDFGFGFGIEFSSGLSSTHADTETVRDDIETDNGQVEKEDNFIKVVELFPQALLRVFQRDRNCAEDFEDVYMPLSVWILELCLWIIRESGIILF